ncbi:MAG: hypothetical protein ACLFNS_04055 [Desulfobacterales bacterium]
MKKFLIGIGVLIVILIIIIAVAVSNLGPMIKTAVNKYGPEITQTEVKLADVDVALFAAEATLEDFLLGNPEGFDTPEAVMVKKIHVNLNEKTIMQDPIVIDRIEVVSPHINYEIKGKTDNFRAILNNIKETTGAKEAPPAEKKPAPPEKEKPKKNIIIKDFILTDGQVDLAMTMLKDQKVTATLPDLHLKNIGEKDGGITPAKALQIIFDAIYEEIQSSQVREALNKELKKLGENFENLQLDAKGQLGDTLKKGQKELDSTADSVKDKVKGLFDN